MLLGGKTIVGQSPEGSSAVLTLELFVTCTGLAHLLGTPAGHMWRRGHLLGQNGILSTHVGRARLVLWCLTSLSCATKVVVPHQTLFPHWLGRWTGLIRTSVPSAGRWLVWLGTLRSVYKI